MSRGQVRQSGSKGVCFRQPGGMGFRPVEGEDAAGPGRWVAVIPEKRFHASGFVKEGQRARGQCLEEVRQVRRVVIGLFGDTGQQGAHLLGLDHAHGCPVHQQQVVAGAGLQRHFPQGDAPSRAGIELLVVLDDPPRRGQLRIDLPAGALLGGEVGHGVQDRGLGNSDSLALEPLGSIDGCPSPSGNLRRRCRLPVDHSRHVGDMAEPWNAATPGQ